MRMKRGSRIVVTLVTVLLLVFTVACAPAVTEEEEAVVTPPVTEEEEAVVTPPVTPAPTVEWGIIEIRVTDPPPADVEHVFVTLANIEVHRVSDNVTGWETIPIPTGNMTFDLMDVIGVEKVLGSANVTAGKYTQIRMDVDSVEVVTVDGDNFTAEVPSGKLKIVRPFEVGAGVTTVLTLDFDGEKSLIITGKGKAIFKPVVKLLIEKEKAEAERAQEQEQEQEGLEFEGTIEAINGDNWTVTIAGETWTVDVSGAEIEGEPEVGLQVEIEGTVVDNIIVASEVEIKEAEGEQEQEQEQEQEGLEFEGTIEAINGDNWTVTIAGETWTVDISGAEIEGEPEVGLQVEIEGTVVDNIIVASEVEIKETEG